MAYNGSGTFVINTAGQPVVPNTVISSTAFNALTADLANGLSTCITKDGQTTPTANIPMGNNKITGLAAGTAGTDAANLSQVQGSTAKLLQSVTGTDTITAAMIPALTTYTAGQMFYFVAAGNNTGPVTINIDSLGAKSVTRDGSTALVSGDIVSGEIALIVYDGTRFQLLNGNSFTNLNVSGTLAVGSTSTFTGAATFSAGTANQVQYLNASKVLTGSANLTFDGTTLTANALTLTNNPTLSGGTANGVLYLNGSKVATSGSALVFDGTNLGVGGSPSVKLDVIGGSINTSSFVTITPTTATNNALYRSINTGGTFFSGIDNSAGGVTGTGYAGMLWHTGNYPMAFAVNNAAQMWLTTTGLGIGTASPITRLDLNKTTSQAPGGTTPNGALVIRNTAAGAGCVEIGSDTPVLGYLQVRNTASQTYYDFALQPNGGNVGVGTTSPGQKLDVIGSGRATGAWAVGDSTGNFSGSMVNESDASKSVTFNADPGNAGANSFMRFNVDGSERARIDSSGNFAIGTTTINYRAVADCNNAANNDNGFAVRNTNASAYGGSYNFEHLVTGGGSAVRASYISSEGGSGNSFMRFATTVSGTLAVRMRITQAGSIVAGNEAALATTATDGFLYVPTCAGTPTGTPTAITGMAPIVVNTTNNKLYFYSGGAWQDAGP